MEIKCPDTGNVVPPEHYNVSTDILISPFSGKRYKLSELIQGQTSADADLDILSNPPSGMREHRGVDGTMVSVSTRNTATALFFIPFTLFWNVMTAVFVIGPWLPGPLSSGEESMPRFGVDPFMTLFLSPFVLAGALTFILAAMALAGRFSIRITDSKLITFRGLGKFGLSRRFDLSRIQNVTVEETAVKQNNTPMKALTLWIPEKKRVGIGLGEVRMKFLAAWLRNELGLNT